MKFKVEGLPPSYNKHFKINYNFRQMYLTREAREFKVRVKMSMPPWTSSLQPSTLFKLTVWYHHKWYYKNGKVRKLDIQNLDKLLIDAIAKKIGVDDCQIFEVHLFKVSSNDTFTEVELEEKMFNIPEEVNNA